MPRDRWALVRLAQEIAKHFDRGWRATPRAAAVIWARTVLYGLGATFLTLFGLIAYGKYRLGHSGEFPWEVKVLSWLEQNSPVGFSSAVWFQTWGTDVMLLVVVLTAASIAMWRERPLLGLNIFLSIVVMDAAVRIGWMSWERLRPDIIAEGIARPKLNSFPSGHTAKTLAVYGLLIAQWFRASNSVVEKGIAVLLALTISLIVPFGRVRMGVHWPTDVMGGWLIAAVWLFFLLWALHRAEQAGSR